MSTFVLPDIHNHVTEAESFVQKYVGMDDTAVFLGDYFDDFSDRPDDAKQVAEWLSHSTQEPNRVHLIGNHDIPYLFISPYTTAFDGPYFCPGFDWDKFKFARPILDQFGVKNKMKICYAVGDNLLSHAGFHSHQLPYNWPTEIGPFVEATNSLLPKLIACEAPSWLINRGSRMGEGPLGGPFWLDWKHVEPDFPLFQVVGHTPADTVRENPKAICIDTKGRFVLRIDGNERTMLPVK